MNGCSVVNVSRMIKCELPPRLREACLQSHGFSFLHQSSDNSFCSTILLVCIGNTLENFNPSFLEHCNECGGGVFSSCVRHPFSYFLLVFCLNHCKEVPSSRQCSILRAQVYCPSMG